MTSLYGELGKEFGKLSTGFGAGIAVIYGELIAFYGNEIISQIINIAQTTSPSYSNVIDIVGFSLVIFVLVGFINTIIIGYFSPLLFSIGYIIGNFIIIKFTKDILWAISPSIVIGLIITVILVVIGILFKVYSGDDISF